MPLPCAGEVNHPLWPRLLCPLVCLCCVARACGHLLLYVGRLIRGTPVTWSVGCQVSKFDLSLIPAATNGHDVFEISGGGGDSAVTIKGNNGELWRGLPVRVGRHAGCDTSGDATFALSAALIGHATTPTFATPYSRGHLIGT